MSVTVQEWPPVEVKDGETLPEYYLGLLDWVLDDSFVPGEEGAEQDLENSPYQAASGKSSTCEVLSSPGKLQIPTQTRAKESSNHELSDNGKQNGVNESINPTEQDPAVRSVDWRNENDLEHKSVSFVNSAREKVLELATKWKIPSEVIQDQPTPETKGSASSWSVSALEKDPATPANGVSFTERDSSKLSCNAELSPQIEELNSPSKPHSLSVAAWVMDTKDAPVPDLVLPKAVNSSTHCCAIDPETGEFLPAIEHPEIKFNHELDLQSEPGWRRGNMTSGMQISRELKARAKLAQRLKERLPTQLEVDSPAAEEAENFFPKADCTIRPATDDDIAGVSEMVNLSRRAEQNDGPKSPSTIRRWDIVKLYNMCKKDQRPFIVATGGEDDLLDRRNWPAGADRAFQEYVKYRSNAEGPQASIVGFAFAAPRQGSSLDAQDVRTDHSCYVTMFVHPKHRNKKYGSALMDRILSSVSPIHRSLIDFEWKCDEPNEIYEHPASNNAQQYARIFVEYMDAHEEGQRLSCRQRVLEKFGFVQVGHLTCCKSEAPGGKKKWLDLFIWQLEAQSLENVR